MYDNKAIRSKSVSFLRIVYASWMCQTFECLVVWNLSAANTFNNANDALAIIIWS